MARYRVTVQVVVEDEDAQEAEISVLRALDKVRLNRLERVETYRVNS